MYLNLLAAPICRLDAERLGRPRLYVVQDNVARETGWHWGRSLACTIQQLNTAQTLGLRPLPLYHVAASILRALPLQEDIVASHNSPIAAKLHALARRLTTTIREGLRHF